jgi:predicted metal-dependent phosphoesterase TrpH
MTLMRGLSTAAVVAGLSAGAALDRIPSPAAADGARAANGEILIAADFHVHTFPGDGILPPWEIGREARRRGLDAVALTSHNQLWSPWLASLAAAGPGEPLILTGQEITAATFHMVGVGLEQAVDWRLPAADTIEAVHRQGGIAIAAHPVRPYWPAYDARSMRLLDGAELQHPVIEVAPELAGELETFYKTAKAHNPRLAAIGSSDFHFGAVLGRCRTYLLVREVTTDAVLSAVRQGRTVAADVAGTLHGDPEMIALVQDHLTRRGPPPGPTRSQTAAALLVLAGLTAAVLFR